MAIIGFLPISHTVRTLKQTRTEPAAMGHTVAMITPLEFTTIAAFPVTGPFDVLGDSGAGVMREDLREACLLALKIPQATARAHAEKFSSRTVTEQFVQHLHP